MTHVRSHRSLPPRLRPGRPGNRGRVVLVPGPPGRLGLLEALLDAVAISGFLSALLLWAWLLG